MNVQELAEWLTNNPITWRHAIKESDREMILRALRLLAAAEANDGTTPDIAGLVDALGHQKQCDEDGVLCAVSRQAVDEARTMLTGLAARVGELEKDAERYRWLRVQRHADIAACWYLPVMPQDYPVDTPEQRDAAIDAARIKP